VARRAGVSRTTVSLVLNDLPDTHITPETRQCVLQAARELNYYPDVTARRLASGRTHTIALVWHHGPDRAYRDAFLLGSCRASPPLATMATMSSFARSSPTSRPAPTWSWPAAGTPTA
jgi:hypothetical protein